MINKALWLAPWLTLGLMVLPVTAGLAGTLVPALAQGGLGFARLADWPGLWQAVALSVGTGFVSTTLALTLTMLILAVFAGTPIFAGLRRLIAPLLSVPHAAAALGLAFLFAPSGWLARLISPELTGWAEPPDLLILNDPWGLSLTLGLVAKEFPFLLLMALAALPQIDADRRIGTAASLGYGRMAGFVLTTWPDLYVQLRLPVYAVLVYGMTTVDMALILGPTLPPTLSVQVTLWISEAALGSRDIAAAGACLQLVVVLAALLVWRGLEKVAKVRLLAHAFGGHRWDRADHPAGLMALLATAMTAGSLGLGLGGLALWSIAGTWQFPDALPETLSLRHWTQALPAMSATLVQTLCIGLSSTLAALVLVVACLQAEVSHGLSPGQGALVLLYLPLLIPQIAFLPGLQVLAIATGMEGNTAAVAFAHLVFVLPYVFLSLSGPYRAWDGRLAIAAATMGASQARIFWRLRLPMLTGPILTAAAIGLAVSVGQYLPSLLIGGGRVETLTTEAVALSSGGNRRLIGAYTLLQLAIPALAFGAALAIPGLVWRNRRAMRGFA